ncbi:MAG: hypothetical protein A2085_00460 [Gemmatimonadetes bacterium GWC2_71_10]|nr:MAG: hypothetical protein A2085_00460 [Gemmatimonadetes bacterium GWC2_71_10]
MPRPSTHAVTRVVSADQIVAAIHVVRGQRVMLDADLAVLYGVTTKRLNEQVRRNGGRFPQDFAFQLTPAESANLRSQFATSSSRHGGRRYAPLVFTEHGAVMLASVLNTRVAVATSVEVVRAFVRLRQLLETNADLARKLDALEKRYDGQFRVVFEAIRELMNPPPAPAKRVGFRTEARSRHSAVSRSFPPP